METRSRRAYCRDARHRDPRPAVGGDLGTGRWAFAVLLFAVLLTSSPARAQFWGGCIDALVRPVLDRPNGFLQDIAWSTLDPTGQPVIEYNPTIVLSVGPVTRRFFYLHECGHHALGQIVSGVNIPFASEQAADCWAANQMIREGLSLAALRQIQADVSHSAGDWSHLPGPQRALNLEDCIKSSGPSGSGRCRTVTAYETRPVPEQRLVPQQVPCTHCTMTPLGPRCFHPFDIVNVPTTVMVPQQVPITRQECDP